MLEKNELPGDVDILLWEDGNPNETIAIECKRVKVAVARGGKETANRLSQIDKGIKQATQLRNHGFHRTYVAFLILTDGRNKTKVNTMFRYAGSDTVAQVYNVPWHSELHADVGVIYIQITQPTGLDFSEMHGLGICIDKEAVKLQQSEKITNRVRELEEAMIFKEQVESYK